MQRYLLARDYVFSRFNQIYNEDLRLMAITHTTGVDTMAAILAQIRNVDPELAKVAALFHDYATFVDNCPHADHPRLSSLHARQYMKASHAFTIEEMDEICFAISQHSLKQQFDTPLAEVLKDADIMAHYTMDPSRLYSGIKRQRIMDCLADLSLHLR